MAILYQNTRRTLGRNQTREYGPLTMPAHAYTRLRVSIDLIEAQRQDATRWVGVDVWMSVDGGTTWTYYMGATTSGHPLRDPAEQSWVELPHAPPQGALVRAVFRAGPDAPVSVGIIVEGLA